MGHDGGNPEFHKHVNETAVDSRTGGEASGAGLHLAASSDRRGMDAGGVSPDAEGWCDGHRRRDGGGLREGTGGQSRGPLEPDQVRPLLRATGATAVHPQGGRITTPSGHPDLRRQGGAAGNTDAPGADLRGGLPSVLIRLPTRAVGPQRPRVRTCGGHGRRPPVGDRRRYQEVLRHNLASAPEKLP